jgi:Putative Actinobacterial Holin-X, holin superfamily III
MPADAQRIPKPTLLSLIRGIVEDAKQLVVGQYEFRRYQTLRQIARAKAMAIWLGIGIVFAAIGTILLTLMVAHLLHDIFNLPLWGSYGIVGIVLIVVGGGCLYGAKSRL